MKLVTAIAGAAVIGTSLIAPNSSKAQNYPGLGCYPPLAAEMYVQMLRGGASPGYAAQAVYNKGYSDGSEACGYQIIGYIEKYGSVL